MSDSKQLVAPKRAILRIKKYAPGPHSTSAVMVLECGHPYTRSTLCLPRDGSLPGPVYCHDCPKETKN